LLTLALSVSACSDKEDDTGSNFGVSTSPTVYPVGQQIMVYVGNGGADGAGGAPGGVVEVSEVWGALGYSTTIVDIFPTDLSTVRAIVMMSPGYYGGALAFSAAEIEAVQTAIAAGTRLIILVDNNACAEAAVTNLLTELEVSISFSGDFIDENSILSISRFDPSQQPLTGITELELSDPCFVNPGDNGSQLFQDDDSNVLGALEQVGNGGDVVLIGDFSFLGDEELLERADNRTFAENLVIIEPSR